VNGAALLRTSPDRSRHLHVRREGGGGRREAIGVIIANNVGGRAPIGGPTDDHDPSVMISWRTETPSRTRSRWPGDPTLWEPTEVAGLHPTGGVRLYAPNPLELGSSVSHFDTSALPDLLMEPAIGGNVEIGDLDLTLDQLRDIGWSPGSSNVVVQQANSSSVPFGML
jgi:hypothetical protein